MILDLAFKKEKNFTLPGRRKMQSQYIFIYKYKRFIKGCECGSVEDLLTSIWEALR